MSDNEDSIVFEHGSNINETAKEKVIYFIWNLSSWIFMCYLQEKKSSKQLSGVGEPKEAQNATRNKVIKPIIEIPLVKILIAESEESSCGFCDWVAHGLVENWQD